MAPLAPGLQRGVHVVNCLRCPAPADAGHPGLRAGGAGSLCDGWTQWRAQLPGLCGGGHADAALYTMASSPVQAALIPVLPRGRQTQHQAGNTLLRQA